MQNKQNAHKAVAVAHRGYVLKAGRDRHEGSGVALLEDAKVGELYLGGARVSR